MKKIPKRIIPLTHSERQQIFIQIIPEIADILDRLDASDDINDMKYPGSDLHQLKGKMKGTWAVKVSKQ